MDRIDIVVDVGRVDPAVVIDAPAGTSSADLLARVLEARERSGRRRLGSTATLTGSTLLEACSMGPEARATLESAARRQHLSGRGITRLLRVARTVADLDGADRVRTEHVIEALGFRARQG